MGGISRQFPRWPADPRIRVLVLLVVFLAALALAWHLIGMADHSAGMGMLGSCLAVLALGLLVLFMPPLRGPIALPEMSRAASWLPRPPLRPRFGRHPPEEGVVLLM
jgi:hypothetical protein